VNIEIDLTSLIKTLPKLPGIYQMLDELGQLLYVGKAKNLRARVSSYFSTQDHSTKTRHLVGRIKDIHTTVTGSETEALLLEQTLIKRFSPPYNILLRDDKSYPYIYISQHEYPRIGSIRGRKKTGHVFGPYPSGSAVRFSLGLLQKAFRIRQCQDSYFRNRSRPCLEYQIQRCSGPCVGLISKQDYGQAVQDTQRFLEGKSGELMQDLTQRMETASQDMAYEQAAVIRDQISTLRQVQEVQHMDTADGEVDIFAVCQDAAFICVQTLTVRGGQLIGGKSHFQKVQLDASDPEILESFVAQYYMDYNPVMTAFPKDIVVSHALPNPSALEALLYQTAQKKIRILKRITHHKQAWLSMAVQNAQQGLQTRQVTHSRRQETYDLLRQWLSPRLPASCVNRFECFDISHTQGEATKASCVVFDMEGPRKDLYRQYNITSTDTGDDYKAMAEVLTRRYCKLNQHSEWPWLVIVDGGLGQLGQAARIFKELALTQYVPELVLLGLAKGVTRKAGFERLFRVTSLAEFSQSLSGEGCIVQLQKPDNELVLRLMHEIRDESHRFAIVGHRKARDKARTKSTLETIPGVGPKRRSAILKYFGGLQGVKRASIDDLSKVDGIQKSLADVIYRHLHE